MTSTLTLAAVVVVVGLLFAAALFVARRILRLAIKLALVGAVVFALFAGGMIGWWRGWFSPSSNVHAPVRQTNTRAPSNTRPSR
jgi:hypothetical protein